MSSSTLTPRTSPAGHDAPTAQAPRIVPRRRPGRWGAAAVILALPASATRSVLRNPAFQRGVVTDYFTSTAILRGLGLMLCSAQLVHHRTYQVVPLLLVATLWQVLITSLPGAGAGQFLVERHHARGPERGR